MPANTSGARYIVTSCKPEYKDGEWGKFNVEEYGLACQHTLKGKTMSKIALQIYIYLSAQLKSGYKDWTLQTTKLCEIYGVSDRHIRTGMKDLREHGYIVQASERGLQYYNFYTVSQIPST